MILLLILIVALITGVTLGFIFERSQFCTVRILNNAFSLKVYEGLAGLIVLILVSVILLNFTLFSGMVTKFNLLHFIDMSPTAIYAPPFVPLANFIGAFLFGVGMVFAGMCVTGMLFRMGEGYLSSLVTLLGIAVGFGIIPVFKGVKIILPKFFTGITYMLL